MNIKKSSSLPKEDRDLLVKYLEIYVHIDTTLLRLERPINWISGAPPRSEPQCGFTGEKCDTKPEWKMISIYIVCCVISIVAGMFIFRESLVIVEEGKEAELLEAALLHDEAHFWLNGYVNKQNCRIWSEANPQVSVETPLHPEKLTVWSALWAGGIIGPYFFKNDEGHNVTVNGDRYRAMITNFFIPELNNHDVQELWFQQDGATCHTARSTIDLLKDTFGDRLISRFGSVNWPPRSCDLTPLDYFLWGYVKSLVYADKPQTLDYLEDNIRRVIADIRPQMLEKVIENWTSRLDYIRASRGSPVPEIIFKI
ncbi:putative transposable element [Trichonephila clavipes]|nr:putative transposable element [Trichonephila clavipes]